VQGKSGGTKRPRRPAWLLLLPRDYHYQFLCGEKSKWRLLTLKGKQIKPSTPPWPFLLGIPPKRNGLRFGLVSVVAKIVEPRWISTPAVENLLAMDFHVFTLTLCQRVQREVVIDVELVQVGKQGL